MGAQPIVLLCTFVHNVSATVSYGKKELLDIRTAITHLGLDKYFSSASRAHRTFSEHPTRPTSQLFARGRDAGTEDTERDASYGSAEGEWKAAVTVNITRVRKCYFLCR